MTWLCFYSAPSDLIMPECCVFSLQRLDYAFIVPPVTWLCSHSAPCDLIIPLTWWSLQETKGVIHQGCILLLSFESSLSVTDQKSLYMCTSSRGLFDGDGFLYCCFYREMRTLIWFASYQPVWLMGEGFHSFRTFTLMSCSCPLKPCLSLLFYPRLMNYSRSLRG